MERGVRTGRGSQLSLKRPIEHGQYNPTPSCLPPRGEVFLPGKQAGTVGVLSQHVDPRSHVVASARPWHRPPLRSIPEAERSGRAGVRSNTCTCVRCKCLLDQGIATSRRHFDFAQCALLATTCYSWTLQPASSRAYGNVVFPFAFICPATQAACTM